MSDTAYDPRWPARQDFWRDAGLSSPKTATLLAAIHDHAVALARSADDTLLAELIRTGYVRLRAAA